MVAEKERKAQKARLDEFMSGPAGATDFDEKIQNGEEMDGDEIDSPSTVHDENDDGVMINEEKTSDED